MNKSRWTVALALGTVGGGLLLAALAFFATSGVRAEQETVPTAARTPTIAWVPESTGLVGYVDLKSFAASPLGDLWKEEARSKARAGSSSTEEGKDSPLGAVDELRNATGIDLWKDVDQVTFSFAVPTPAEEPESGAGGRSRTLSNAPRQAWGMVVSGRFDPSGLARKASEHEGATKPEDYHGIKIYPLEGSGPGDERHDAALAVPSDAVLLLGTPDYVREMIDCGQGRATSAARTIQSWGYGDFAGDALWVVGKPQGAMDSMLGAVGGGAGSGPALRSFSLSGRFESDLLLTARGRAADADSAQKLADVLRGFVALGRLRQSDSPQLAGLADAIQIGLAGDEIHVGLSVPYETIRSLVETRRAAGDR